MLISINERGIFNVNVYSEMKTDFKILVYFITFSHSRKKSQEHTYHVHIYVKFIFYKSKYVRGKQHTHISMPILCVRNIYT